MTKYAAWIQEYVARFEHPAATLGKCQEATEEMKEAFPELEVRKGHVHCPWGKRGHWWLVDPEGNIVDPTKSQFTCGIFEYEEYQEGDSVRVGRCMNCGEEIWGPPEKDGACICGPECHDAYAAYLNAEMGQ